MSQVLKTGVMSLLIAGTMLSATPAAFAQDGTITTNPITGRSVIAGVLSLLVWPGIGQAVNQDPGKKVATHAIIGLFPPFRFWSGYDALVDRDGGYWDGRI